MLGLLVMGLSGTRSATILDNEGLDNNPSRSVTPLKANFSHVQGFSGTLDI